MVFNHNPIGTSSHLPTLSFFVFLHWVEKKPSLDEGFLVVEESSLKCLGEFLSLTFLFFKPLTNKYGTIEGTIFLKESLEEKEIVT